MRFARTVDDVVVEIIAEANGFTIHEMFHPEFVANLKMIGDDVQIGWIFSNGAFSAPAEAY